MRIDFVSLFPDMVLAAVRHSMLKRAEEGGILAFGAANPRDFATDTHKTVDDEPYGGGPGMVLKPDVVAAAIESLTPDAIEAARGPGPDGVAIIFTDPMGDLFIQRTARKLSRHGHLIFVCGHYEGIDERVAEKYATHRLSIGDYVLTGGELPAAVMADAIARLLPGVLGAPGSLDEDAFADGLLTYPQYTRPAEWQGLKVPDILTGGDHGAVAAWRRRQRLIATRLRRPDLFARAPLSKEDLKLLQ